MALDNISFKETSDSAAESVEQDLTASTCMDLVYFFLDLSDQMFEIIHLLIRKNQIIMKSFGKCKSYAPDTARQK